MNPTKWSAFVEAESKVHIVEMLDGVRKIKGLGVIDTNELFSNIEIGEEVLVGQKVLTRVPLRLPEMSKGMLRRAQTCLLYTSPSPRDRTRSRMPSSA